MKAALESQHTGGANRGQAGQATNFAVEHAAASQSWEPQNSKPVPALRAVFHAILRGLEYLQCAGACPVPNPFDDCSVFGRLNCITGPARGTNDSENGKHPPGSAR